MTPNNLNSKAIKLSNYSSPSFSLPVLPSDLFVPDEPVDVRVSSMFTCSDPDWRGNPFIRSLFAKPTCPRVFVTCSLVSHVLMGYFVPFSIHPQMLSLDKNPFSWNERGNINGQIGALSLTTKDGSAITVENLSEDIEVRAASAQSVSIQRSSHSLHWGRSMVSFQTNIWREEHRHLDLCICNIFTH